MKKTASSKRAMRVEVLAPAKLNLRLKLVGRRSDGYHLLRMFNVTTTLVDELTIAQSESARPQFSVSGKFASALQFLPPEENLVLKSVELFCKTFSVSNSVNIDLKKSIPLGSGLGGGSSDAAATLRGLWALYFPEHPLPIERLRQIGLELGADVPYFISGGPAWVSGIGDEIEFADISSLGIRNALIVVPPVSVSTAAVYGAVRDSRRELAPEPLVPIFRLPDIVENDLRPYAEALAPEIAITRKGLESLDLGVVGMTGSGSGLFVLLESDKLPDPSSIRKEVGDQTFLCLIKPQ